MQKTYTFYLFLMLMLGAVWLPAQQLPVHLTYLYDAAWYNPALKGTDDFNRFYLQHQQRNLAVKAFSHTDEVRYSSRALGGKKKFGFGSELSVDQEFTIQRLNLSTSMAVHLFHRPESKTEDRPYRWSIGGQVGIARWTENFSNIAQGDPGDQILLGQSDTRLDLGFGTDAFCRMNGWEMTLGGTAFHLREWLGSAQGVPHPSAPIGSGETNPALLAWSLVPHFMGNARISRKMGQGTWVGGTALYKEVIGENWGIRGGQFDVAGILDFRRKGFWVSGGSRMGYGDGFALNAFHAGGGMQFWQEGSLRNHPKAKHSLHGLAQFEMPLQAQLLGPRFELGLRWDCGQILKDPPIKLIHIRGPFWYNSGNAVDFLGDRTGDTSLTRNFVNIQVDNQKKYVRLTYSFYENSLPYHPEDIPGVRTLLTHIGNDVIREAFAPLPNWEDSLGFELSELTSIRIEAFIKEDQENTFLVKGAKYADPDTLIETIILDEQDSVYQMLPSPHVTPVDLAFLKLVYFRDLLKEKSSLSGPSKTSSPVHLYPLKITTNNPNQKGWQLTTIELEFKRRKRSEKGRKGR